jgi:hypothetical protein
MSAQHSESACKGKVIDFVNDPMFKKATDLVLLAGQNYWTVYAVATLLHLTEKNDTQENETVAADHWLLRGAAMATLGVFAIGLLMRFCQQRFKKAYNRVNEIPEDKNAPSLLNQQLNLVVFSVAVTILTSQYAQRQPLRSLLAVSHFLLAIGYSWRLPLLAPQVARDLSAITKEKKASQQFAESLDRGDSQAATKALDESIVGAGDDQCSAGRVIKAGNLTRRYRQKKACLVADTMTSALSLLLAMRGLMQNVSHAVLIGYAAASATGVLALGAFLCAYHFQRQQVRSSPAPRTFAAITLAGTGIMASLTLALQSWIFSHFSASEKNFWRGLQGMDLVMSLVASASFNFAFTKALQMDTEAYAAPAILPPADNQDSVGYEPPPHVSAG